jgi:Zn-dependent M28 family amino/carboxypeptidase
VPQGPGIQDNGSGSGAILEIAIQMATLELEPRNKVRFAWWGAEESGLVGSQFYVDNLTAREIKNIAINLNFDMIGSPNFVRFVYDGDGSDTPLRGPAGSKAAEEVFLDYFAEQGLENEPTAFDGRSDYGPFIAVGIPAGGLSTGAEGIKTEEQELIYGGTAGEQYDQCYHLACDTFDNISLEALDQMSDAAAHAVLTFAMTTSAPGGTAQASGKAEDATSVDDLEFLGSHKQK